MKKKVGVVIPTCRSIDNLLDWEEEFKDAKIYVIVDDDVKYSGKLPDLEVDFFYHSDIDEELGDDSWIISKNSDAIRNFGFLKAYQDGADYIMTIDDDCYPLPTLNNFVQNHISNLKLKKPGERWFSTLKNLIPRGFPESGMSEIMLSVGGWVGTPDLSAESWLKFDESMWNSSTNEFNFGLIPIGKYLPLSGMNLAFRREIAPLMYFTLSGKGYEYHRFADIWCGIIVKKILDHLNFLVSFGYPFIFHNKIISDAQSKVNLALESKAKVFNEKFWRIVDEIPLDGDKPVSCFLEIATFFTLNGDAYLKKLGKAMIKWVSLFEK